MYLDFVSTYIESISETLRPISLKIHDNPELNFKEFIAHETLTKFMKTRKGWKVTPSAYGIETAFTAVYDSGKKGPVISYNAEYGQYSGCNRYSRSNNLMQMHSQELDIRVATTSSPSPPLVQRLLPELP